MSPAGDKLGAAIELSGAAALLALSLNVSVGY
jgi:hypothetical protein